MIAEVAGTHVSSRLEPFDLHFAEACSGSDEARLVIELDQADALETGGVHELRRKFLQGHMLH